MKIESLDDAASYLEGLINVERDPGHPYRRMDLTPATALLERLGRPQDGLSIIHVAGSKGKGSTCLIAEAMLTALGERVGTFTSPHLVHWTERFRVAGREVEGRALARVVDRIRPHVEELRGVPETAPSFFDATTAAALLLFAEAGADRVLLEVGLGGRLDSTNVVHPAVTCISSIELEHTDRLGDTHAKIAAEKAGILKPGVPCVVGSLSEEALGVVMGRVDQLGVPVRVAERDFTARSSRSATGPGGLATVEYDDGASGGFAFDWSVPGRHQIHNAALAIECVGALRAHPAPALVTAARKAFADLSLPGRLELVGREPWQVIDAAHTPASAQELAHFLETLQADRLHLVLSVSADKALEGVLAPLLAIADTVTATCIEPVRSIGAEDLAEAVARQAPGIQIHVQPDPRQAIETGLAGAGPGDALCVAGSVYLAGVAREVLGRPGAEA